MNFQYTDTPWYDVLSKSKGDYNTGLINKAYNSLNGLTGNDYSTKLNTLNKETINAYNNDKSLFNSNNSFLNLSPSTINTGLTGLRALGGLASGLAAYKSMGMAKEAMNHNIMDSNRNYALAKEAYDRKVKRGNSIHEQMSKGI